MALTLNAVINFFHRTLSVTMLYYKTKYGCKWTSSLEDIVETVLFWLFKPSLWLNLHIGSPSCGGEVAVNVFNKNKPNLSTPVYSVTNQACPLLFISVLVSISVLYGPFNCISLHNFSWQLSAFSLCSSSLISALLILSTIYLFKKVSFSPDILLCGWLGSKHQLTN